VLERESHQPVGQVELLKQVVKGVEESEIGYVRYSPCWRRRYAAETASGVRDHAYDMLGKRRLISRIRPVNIPSQRVAQRIGSIPERVVMFHEMEYILFAQQRAS
jgi:ribosomal-protein-alanine N-acetyltransferase